MAYEARRQSVVEWSRERWDKLVASDPGLARLRMATAGAVSMATTLGVEFAVFGLAGAGAQTLMLCMLLGAVVAMIGSNPLTGSDPWLKVRTAAFFPVAVGAGMFAAMALAGHSTLLLAGFVAVMFVAVFIRRFGMAFFFYGFMCWMGYFFASFLNATLSMLPVLLLATAISSAWVLLLSLTVLRTNAPRTMRRTIRAFDATSRAVARAAADVLEHSVARESLRGPRRRLHAQQTRLADVALLVEGRSEEPAALPADWSGPVLRRRMLDAHQAVDAVAAAAEALADAEPPFAAAALPVLERLARRDDAGAKNAVRTLAAVARSRERSRDGWWPARHLVVAAGEFVTSIGAVTSPRVDVDTDEEVDEFEPVVSLALGNLPGSGPIAKEVPARGGRWNPLARLEMSTRQAIQVAFAGTLAILVGQQLSPTGYYWAAIASFIMFTGASTRAETFLKGFNRVLGTLLGLLVSIWLANLTAGHTAWALILIVACMFFGFYLLQRSYVYMIFFVTVMIGQLYTVLHQFSGALLVLRMEETVVGALIGFAVAMVVVPLSTRDTVRSARDNLLDGLAELLEAAAHRLCATTPDTEETPPTLDALARSVDDLVRQLALVAKPLTRPIIWGNSPSTTRHRLTLYAAAAGHARGLAVALRQNDMPPHPEDLAAACRALAEAATRMTRETPGRHQPAVAGPLDAADTALFAEQAIVDETVTDPVRRSLHRIRQLLLELAAAGEPVRPRQAPAGNARQ